MHKNFIYFPKPYVRYNLYKAETYRRDDPPLIPLLKEQNKSFLFLKKEQTSYLNNI